MKRGVFLLVCLSMALIIFMLNTTSAEILLSQPNNIYNLGDNLNLEATVKPSQYTSAFFELNLKCGESSVNIHKEHLTLNAKENKKISSSLSLAKSFLGDMKGNCNVLALFGSESAESQIFIVSDRIVLILSLENISINSGEQVVLKGTALRENTGKVNGFLDISVERTGIKVTREVEQGEFETSILFPDNTRAGVYVLKARVYEKYQGEETNFGEAQAEINIKKSARKVEIALSKQSLLPTDTLTFSPIIYDQANEKIEGEISIRIYDPFDKIFSQEIIKSGEEKTLELETDSSPGYWKIEANSLNLESRRLFYVEELEKASFNLENDTLIITNIGNVVYNKPVQISIGEVTEIKNINLDVGESKKLKLLAPKGNYNIRATDGEDELVLEGISLTGRVVGVSEVSKGLGFIRQYPVVWIFLIAVFALFIIILVQRISKKRFISRVPQLNLEEKKMFERREPEKKVIAGTFSLPGKAEHSLVLHGNKENTSLITLKIKDLDRLKRTASITIQEIIKKIIDNKGAIYEAGDYIIGVFSPVMTKTFGNEIITVKISRQINDILKEHNRKFREKIDYGVGLNSGDLVVKKESDSLKFTTIGNTINLSKRIADLAKNEVLLSENVQKKVMAEIRADREVRGGISVYHVKSIVDRDKNKVFIQDFLHRLDKDKPLEKASKS